MVDKPLFERNRFALTGIALLFALVFSGCVLFLWHATDWADAFATVEPGPPSLILVVGFLAWCATLAAFGCFAITFAWLTVTSFFEALVGEG